MLRVLCRKSVLVFAAASVLSGLLSTDLRAAEPQRRPMTDVEKKAIDYLLSKQEGDGSWLKQAGPAVTAMIIKGLIQSGRTVEDPAIKKGLAFIDTMHKPDGGWYDTSLPTYNTSIVLGMMAVLPESAQKKDQIAAAQAFLKSIQSGATAESKDDKGAAVNKDHAWFGGWGYHQGTAALTGAPPTRPDMSNSKFVVEALRDSGVPSSDASIQNFLVFAGRVQAWEGNTSPWAKGLNSGGFIYSMRWNDKHQFWGESEGPDTRDRDGKEVLTTYGSMTYAGLKSLLHAEVKKDDPRVTAAIKWISGNYTLDQNPGLNNEQGLYYYFHTFSAALKAYGENEITDARGVKHDWRKELEAKLAKLQAADGSFTNTAPRWMESNPLLATTYVLLALEQAR